MRQPAKERAMPRSMHQMAMNPLPGKPKGKAKGWARDFQGGVERERMRGDWV